MLSQNYVKKAYQELEQRYPEQKEYLQAVYEVLESIQPVIDEDEVYMQHRVLERLLEPERIIIFRVTWVDDQGHIQLNRGYRVQHSALLGPYKGGLRFHRSVNLSILKFLGFEQTFKNALTNLPLGGGKGGSDFSPKHKSDQEIMRFCQAYMLELYRHLGEHTDVPAGDIGVGAREIGYLYGFYKKIRNEVTGTLTGKGISYGGSLGRKEATGYGLVYFAEEALKTIKHTSFKDKKVLISGSGNVAIYAAEKVKDLGGIVIGMSDSTGYITCEKGVDLELIKTIKEQKRACIDTYPTEDASGTYHPNPEDMWQVPCDIALPCATQNELTLDAAKALVKHGVLLIAEGANMPSTNEAIDYFKAHNVLFAPGKAANAGGVSVSGLEMAQNATHIPWSFEKVDQKLKSIMKHMLKEMLEIAASYGKAYDLLFGANAYAFKKLADAMMAQGIV